MRIGHCGSLLFLATTFVLGATTPRASVPLAPRYAITDLGTLGGAISYARDINNKGQVVGNAETAGGENHAFLWHDGKMTDLGTLPGFRDSYATAINDKGQVVGYASTSQGGQIRAEAFFWDQGKMRGLGTLGGNSSQANDINDQGAVVGVADTDDTGYEHAHAFLWRSGDTKTDLGLLPGGSRWSQALAINNQDEIVGHSTIRGGLVSACLWRDGKIYALKVDDRAPLFSGHGYAQDINDESEVVGYRELASMDSSRGLGDTDAILWEEGRMRLLGHLPDHTECKPAAINRHGDVVGQCFKSIMGAIPQRAFLSRRGRVMDLNDAIDVDSGWRLHIAAGINDREQVVGIGTINGQDHAFLLTPR